MGLVFYVRTSGSMNSAITALQSVMAYSVAQRTRGMSRRLLKFSGGSVTQCLT